MSAASVIPEWVEETPAEETPVEIQYEVDMWDVRDNHATQSISLTRAEYIAVKAHLAALRGYTLGKLSDRIDELTRQGAAIVYIAGDSQQTAMALAGARRLSKNSIRQSQHNRHEPFWSRTLTLGTSWGRRGRKQG